MKKQITVSHNGGSCRDAICHMLATIDVMQCKPEISVHNHPTVDGVWVLIRAYPRTLEVQMTEAQLQTLAVQIEAYLAHPDRLANHPDPIPAEHDTHTVSDARGNCIVCGPECADRIARQAK